MKKLLPIGYSDFKDLIDKNLYYIDKTLLVDELEKTGAQVVLIPRPRRFGKTLNLSMLRYFYEKNETSNAYLFEDTAIWKRKEYQELQGTFPVIFVSFKDCKKLSWKEAFGHIKTIISKEFERHASHLLPTLHGIDLQKYKNILEEKASQNVLEDSLYLLSKMLKDHHKKQVIILIDEYDTPIRAAYDNDYYDEAINFMRSLLSVALKDNSYLERGILTGIMRAAKEGIFSGLNNLRVCSLLDKRFSDKFGFTESEVDQFLQDYKIKIKPEIIKAWYNGYRSGDTFIYNPWSILECVSHNGELGAYWSNTSDNAIIKKILPLASDETRYDLEVLMQGGTIEKEINEGIIFPGIEKEESAIWNLLFFAGYLTYTKRVIAGGYWQCTLKLPNEEINSLYRKLISSLIESSIGSRKINMLIVALQTGDSDTMTEILDEYIRSSFSSFDIPATEPEKSYHFFMLGLLVALHDTYEVKSNKESGHGRYDIMLIPYDTKKAGIIIEFKKVSRPLKETLSSAAKKALKQIHEKKYATELSMRKFKKIIAYGIAFQGKRVLVVKEQIK